MASRKGSNAVIFTYGENNYTLRQYCEMYKHSFPCFVMVTQGYHGENEMDVLGYGQIMRIHSCVYQKRAVAADDRNRTLSIPVNYPDMFRIVGANKKVSKDEDTLINILTKNQLPVTIQVSDSKKINFNMNNALHNDYVLGILSIKDVYEETYFLANDLETDGTPHPGAHLIPLYMGDILVAPITGIQGRTQAAWEAYKTDISELCKRVQIPLDTGLKEIALYSPQSIKGSDNVYDFIEPSSYIYATLDETPQRDDTQKVTSRPSSKKAIKPPMSLPKEKEDEGPPKLPLRKQKSQLLQDCSKSVKSSHPYVNDIERATVAPFKKIAEDAAKNATGTKFQSQGQIEEAKNKPVSQLSIDELGDKLTELKLDKYLKSFKEHGVDGELALDLSESILREDFKFSKFESLKLMKFVRTGHIPK